LCSSSLRCLSASAAPPHSLLLSLFFLSSSGAHRDLHSFPTRRSSDLGRGPRTARHLGEVRRRHRCRDGRAGDGQHRLRLPSQQADRKSTRLNSSHVKISYAVFCLKKKKQST